VRLLLDTHVWLWLLTQPGRIRSDLMPRLESNDTELYLSIASAWEIAIKYALGKLPLPDSPVRYVPTRLEATGVRQLPIGLEHTLMVAELPTHHRDPFDRLLVSQARIENMPLVTADPIFDQYDIEVVAAEQSRG